MSCAAAKIAPMRTAGFDERKGVTAVLNRFVYRLEGGALLPSPLRAGTAATINLIENPDTSLPQMYPHVRRVMIPRFARRHGFQFERMVRKYHFGAAQEL